ncbi:MAG: hypothetical protein FJ012_07965 [Chloroflexi bacterium]|nr:hypothetical protein [Chloroflexota bacterium]
MKESFKAKLWVNNVSIDLNPFVEEFLARTVAGAVQSLKGAEDMHDLELYVEQGRVRVVADGNELPITPFPNDIIVNTVTGLVSTLKDVCDIERLKIHIRRLEAA